MITSERNLIDSLNFLINEIDSFDRKLNNNMESSSFNNISKDIETHINKLYEKMRVLEDVKNYIRTFTVKAIQEKRNKILSNQKVIEASADKDNKNTTAVTHVINFNNYNQHVTDRNGEVIDVLVNDNGKLVIPSRTVNKENLIGIINKGQVKTKNELEIDDSNELVQISQAEQLNEATLSSLDNNPFVGIYESYEPVNGGIINEYEVSFSTRANCNKIDFRPVNCDIIKVTVTTFDGKVVDIENDQTYLKEPIDIEKMNILVRCTNYDREKLEVLDNLTKDSFDIVL